MSIFRFWNNYTVIQIHKATHTHTPIQRPFCPGQPRWVGARKVKPIWTLLKQETVSGSGTSWAICKSDPRSRHIKTPAPHYSVFYRSDALPAVQPKVSKHWKQLICEATLLLQTQLEENNNCIHKTPLMEMTKENKKLKCYTYKRTNERTHERMHARTLARKEMHARTHARTHTHTHSYTAVTNTVRRK